MRRLSSVIFRTVSQSKKLTDKYKLSDDEIASILKKAPPKSISGPESLTPISKQNASKDIATPPQEAKQLLYGLPLVNEPFPFVQDEQQRRITHETPTQNLFEALQLNALSSYEDYERSIAQTYNNELDMYGDEAEEKAIQVKNLEFGSLLTYESKYLAKLRENHTVNINIPGTIECEDPNNFLTLRPIEEFRHTPLIPISESAMKKHKEMLEEYHRRAFVFEVSRETVLNYALMIAAGSVLIYLVNLVLQKEEETSVSYQRLKYKRILGEENKQALI